MCSGMGCMWKIFGDDLGNCFPMMESLRDFPGGFSSEIQSEVGCYEQTQSNNLPFRIRQILTALDLKAHLDLDG